MNNQAAVDNHLHWLVQSAAVEGMIQVEDSLVVAQLVAAVVDILHYHNNIHHVT